MEMVPNLKQRENAQRALETKRAAEEREALDTNRAAAFRSYLDKRGAGRRYDCHPNSTPRRVKEGTFPPATIWLGPASPRWDAAELYRYDALLALTGDLRQATAQVLAERAKWLQGA